MPVTFKVVGSEVEIIKSFIFKRVIVVLYGLTVFENGCNNSGVRFYVFLLDLKVENRKFSLFFLFFMNFILSHYVAISKLQVQSFFVK